jgi:hypothetical protein
LSCLAPKLGVIKYSADVSTTLSKPPFSLRHSIPSDKPPSTRPSHALLHVFVGTATVNGRTAPDGTLVAVYVTGAKSSTLTIDATAFDKSGQSGKASLDLTISATPVAAGEAEVVDGNFTVTAVQTEGQSFNGKTVTFTVGVMTSGRPEPGKRAGQTLST